MSRLITSADRITKARTLIQQARDLPAPEEQGWINFTYVAQVKDLLRSAYELIKFIPKMPGASDELKAQALLIQTEAKQAEDDILHRKSD